MKTHHFIIILILSIIGGIAGYFIASEFIDQPTYSGTAGALEGFCNMILYFSAISFGFGVTGLLTIKIIKMLLQRTSASFKQKTKGSNNFHQPQP